MREPRRRNDIAWMEKTIARILAECPRRQATTDSERRSQEILRDAFARDGVPTAWHEFRFNRSLYEALALHFGLGALGNAVGLLVPPAGAALHGLAAASYWADSSRRRYLLRRLLPFRPSQNLLAILPADGPPALRIVLLGHADAAFHGWLFDPWFIRRVAKEPPRPLRFLKRSLGLATRTEAALAVSNAARTLLGPLGLPLLPLEALLAIPGVIAFLLNLQIVLHDEVVPGVADNLTGAVALPILARRLAPTKRSDVEIVFAVTGCEEAGLGGAEALEREMSGVWEKDRTVVVALDTLSNGRLRYLSAEGEVVQTPSPRWIIDLMDDLRGRDPRFATIDGFEPPVGGSDAIPFLVRGWDATCFTCIDDEIGAPRHYHCASDDLENLDRLQLAKSLDVVETFLDEVVRLRLG